MAIQVSEISSLATLSVHAAPADQATLRQMAPALLALLRTCLVGLCPITRRWRRPMVFGVGFGLELARP